LARRTPNQATLESKLAARATSDAEAVTVEWRSTTGAARQYLHWLYAYPQ
jgi:hypothetical protein